MRRRWFALWLLFALLASPLTVLAQEATPAADTATGADDGAVVLPTNQIITPAGRQIEFQGRPVDVALHPDGRTAAYLTNADFDPAAPKAPIAVVDLTTDEVKQRFDPGAEPGAAQSSYAGIAYSPDGSQLYASDYTVPSISPTSLRTAR